MSKDMDKWADLRAKMHDLLARGSLVATKAECDAYKSKMLRKWAKEHGVPTVEVSVSEDDIGDVAMPIVKGE